jgi:hypothetical protein
VWGRLGRVPFPHRDPSRFRRGAEALLPASGRIDRLGAVSLESARANDLSHQVSAYRIRIDCIGARRDEESYAAEMLLTLGSNSPMLHRSAS